MSYRHDLAVVSRSTDRPGTCWIDISSISRSLGRSVTADVADLLDVAVAAYSADRRSRRDYSGSSTGRRSIVVELAVRNPDRWSAPEVVGRLQDYLHWLSGDEWTFGFRKKLTIPSEAESQPPLFAIRPSKPSFVSLFSGGVDSLAGLGCAVVDQPCASHVLVSGYTNTRLRDRQRKQIRQIRSEFDRRLPGGGSSIWHLAVGFGINQPDRRAEERSQRTRAFVFLALGVAAAIQVESDTLCVYENGLGALNLRLNETQLGVDNYRGVHPRSLMSMEGLLPLVLDAPVLVENPYFYRTKAEMCRALPVAGLEGLINDTVSCDSFPMRIPDEPDQCGVCTSCILRRQALLSAGLGARDCESVYRSDIWKRDPALSPDQLHGMIAMQNQVFRLAKSLGQDDPWTALTGLHPELERTSWEISRRSGTDFDICRRECLRLIRAFVAEWENLPPLVRQ